MHRTINQNQFEGGENDESSEEENFSKQINQQEYFSPKNEDITLGKFQNQSEHNDSQQPIMDNHESSFQILNLNNPLGQNYSGQQSGVSTPNEFGRSSINFQKQKGPLSRGDSQSHTSSKNNISSNVSIKRALKKEKDKQKNEIAKEVPLEVEEQDTIQNPQNFNHYMNYHISRMKTMDRVDRAKDKVTRKITLNPKKLLDNKSFFKDKKAGREVWSHLQNQVRYTPETAEHFTAIKDIFKNRKQFSQHTQKLMKKLEDKCQIGFHEFSQNISKMVNTERKNNLLRKQQIMEYNELENEQEEKGYFAKQFDYHLRNIKDEQSFYVHDKVFKFGKNSIGMLNNRMRFRFYMVLLVTNKKFEQFITFLILLNSVLLGIKDYTDNSIGDDMSLRNKIVDIYAEPFFSYIFLFECMAKVLAQGFFSGRNSYLSDSWNWLDFVVVATSFLDKIPAMSGMSGLRTFRLFRPLRSLTTMPSMKLLIGTLLSSVAQLGGIMGLAIFIFLIFAILGITLWAGKIHYRCYLTEWPDANGNWELYPNFNRLCSNVNQCPDESFCNSRYVAWQQGYNITQENIYIDSDISELNYGITNFDNIGSAFLTIFQCITMEGWTKVMDIFEDAYNPTVVNLYFILCVVICSFFLLNLTIAVMLMKYQEIDKNQTNSSQKEEMHQIGKKINLPPALIDFLLRTNNIRIQKSARKLMKKDESFFQALFAKKKHFVNLNHRYYKKTPIKFCYNIIMNPNFDVFIILVIILNTLTLAMDQYPEQDENILFLLNVGNILFTSIFTIEAVIKMIGFGIKEYVKDKLNLFDLAIVIISLVEMMMPENGSGGALSSFRAFRLFKIFRMFKAGDLRILLDSIQFTLTTIGDYVILLTLFMYVFALLGMSSFAGGLKFTTDTDKFDTINGVSPRSNFDDVFMALMTIFMVLIGEGWNKIMYICMRSTDPIGTSIFFIFLVLGGNIIMLNLFLAILLGNFDKARLFGEKKKILEVFKEIMNTKNLNQAIDIIMGDLSIHVKKKILKWDEFQVDKLHRVGDTRISMELVESNLRFVNEKTIDENENIYDKKIAQSYIDLESDSSEDEKVDEQQANKSTKQITGGSTLSIQENLKQSIMKQVDKKKNLLQIQDQLNTANSKMKDQQQLKKDKRFARTTEKIHLQKSRLMRLRELNRQYNLFPFPGLKEIIHKKDLEKSKIVNIEMINNFYLVPDTYIVDKKQEPLSLEKLLEAKTIQSDGNPMRSKIISNLQDIVQKKHQTIDHDRKIGAQNDNINEPIIISLSKLEQNPNVHDHHHQHSDTNEDFFQLTLKERIINYAGNSSLFIFHIDWRIRQFLLKIVETPQNLEELEKMKKLGRLEEYECENNSDEEDSDNESKMSKKVYSEQMKWQPKKIFDKVILFLILLSSVILVSDNPLSDPDSVLVQTLQSIDIILTCLFFVEAMMKIIAKGLFRNKLGPVQPYTASNWNCLDGFVVAASCLDFTFYVLNIDSQKLQALKSLRALRALRPLRVISKNEGMRLVVNALLASIPSMTNVLMVCTLFILIFSIMGVNQFKGSFSRCKNDSTSDIIVETHDVLQKIITRQDCIDYGGVWANDPANFDNTYAAMNTLFIMTTTEGWVDIMFNGVDAVGIDMQPKQDQNVAYIIYFVAFMIVGSQFIINLFVGVVIDNFNLIKEKEEFGNMFVTESQKSWIEIQKIGQSKSLKIKQLEPSNYQKVFFRLVKSSKFEHTITFFILLNTMIMAIQHYGMDERLLMYSENANYVFAFVFNVEMILKLLGLGRNYFLQHWNLFDMFIVFATDIGIVMTVFNIGGNFSATATVIRSFRIMRAFKLLRASVHLRLILDTVFNILPQIQNVMSLILLLFFIYAALGINLFSQIRYQDNLNFRNNFRTFFASMKILMKFLTGEDWNLFMFELANSEAYMEIECIDLQTYEDMQREGIMGCGTSLAYPYFITFQILVSMLIMNLSVAAVIEGLDTAKKENMGVIAGDCIEQLIDFWQYYDPDATGWISMKDLVFLLYELPAPLGKRSTKFLGLMSNEAQEGSSGIKQQDRYLINFDKGIVIKKIDALDLLKDVKIRVHMQQNQIKVHFVDVFKALAERIFVNKQIDYKLSPNLNKKINTNWNKKHQSSNHNKTRYTAREEQAGLIITKWARKVINYQNTKRINNNFKNKKKKQKEKSNIEEGSRQKIERTKQLVEQAKVIFNIIKQIPDEEHKYNQFQDQYKIKNSYTWQNNQGSQKIIENLYENKSDMDSQSEKQESINEIDIQIQDFLGLKRNTVLDENNENRIRISVMDMNTGYKDQNQLEYYTKDLSTGEIKRDLKYEQIQKKKAFKDQDFYDMLEDVNNMPNEKYNIYQTQKIARNLQVIKRKQKAKAIEEKKQKQMIPKFERTSQFMQTGITGKTIEIDDDYHQKQMVSKRKDRDIRLMLQDSQNKLFDKNLKAEEKEILDIVQTKLDRNILPAKAHYGRRK